MKWDAKFGNKIGGYVEEKAFHSTIITNVNQATQSLWMKWIKKMFKYKENYKPKLGLSLEGGAKGIFCSVLNLPRTHFLISLLFLRKKNVLCVALFLNNVKRNVFRFKKTWIYLHALASCLAIFAQRMKFSIKDFFNRCGQTRSFLWIWSDLLKKSLIVNLIFCAANVISSFCVWLLLKLAEDCFETFTF